MAETNDISSFFGEVFDPMADEERAAVVQKIAEFAQPYTTADGSIKFLGRSLVASADA